MRRGLCRAGGAPTFCASPKEGSVASQKVAPLEESHTDRFLSRLKKESDFSSIPGLRPLGCDFQPSLSCLLGCGLR
ncbi:UNVERIFIED_CONTAM: hypothetical protein FKN15_032030 [Acipenser sinensis]